MLLFVSTVDDASKYNVKNINSVRIRKIGSSILYYYSRVENTVCLDDRRTFGAVAHCHVSYDMQ